MQFKHPELLYALFLLLIPIIVHLFQLRRFQKVPFTNVKFLKNVITQTRKSSQLKKWLTLVTRMLLFAAIIFAFSQPYFSNSTGLNVKTETLVYLDNSFSMQAKGGKGELLKRSVQDILNALDDTDELTLFTNDNTFRNATRKTLSNELLELSYSSNQLDYDAVILKGEKLFSQDATSTKNLVLLSDFQTNNKAISDSENKEYALNLVQLQAVTNKNISLDSVYISKETPSNFELTATISGSDNFDNLSVALYNDDLLLAKSAINDSKKALFTLPTNTVINGKVAIEDSGLNFDNTLYFNINNREKINVLTINPSENNYLKRIFSENEFNYRETTLEQLNYNEIDEQNLVIVNEVANIPISLTNSLNSYKSNGGNILIIPSDDISLNSYNQLFNYNSEKNIVEKKITTINYSHPLLDQVFDKQISNFQYPKVNSFYELGSGSSILKFEDGKPFLNQQGTIFAFASALNTTNSNFINSPLVVPVIYNIGRQSLKLPNIFYVIGAENNFDVNVVLQQDAILKLELENEEIIPQQRSYSNKVAVVTTDLPTNAGIYNVSNNGNILKKVSYNYNRNESNLQYMNLTNFKNATVTNSIEELFTSIKNKSNINELWKWFTIFALVLLVIEMLILKYFK
ncbi:BatA domain-containing protein [Pontimicrobium sp. SW4]|uniref:BatA domain-containing protein n=1 Tax=Pontimicrobium sp. SW4 TaxID=3153519 RepID=A0AAU7BX22_9FLAO